jgi:hypothetical protein
MGGRPIPGSRRLVASAGAHHNIYTGTTILIDPEKGQDGFAPLTLVTSERCFPEAFTFRVMKAFPTGGANKMVSILSGSRTASTIVRR